MIQAKTSTGGTILTEAVGSGSSGAIEAVMDAMSDVLKRDQVHAYTTARARRPPATRN